MDLQSWAAFATILAALVALFVQSWQRDRKFESKFDGLRTDLNVVDGRLDAKIDALGQKLDAKIDALGQKLDAKIDALDQKLDTKIDRVRDELRSELHDGFGRVDARLTVIEQRTYDLSARLPPAPAAKHG